MFFRRIDVFMAKDIRHKINISSLLIQRSPVSASELMGRYFFIRSDLAGLFLYHILYCLHAHAPLLNGEEQSVLMAGEGINRLPVVFDVV